MEVLTSLALICFSIALVLFLITVIVVLFDRIRYKLASPEKKAKIDAQTKLVFEKYKEREEKTKTILNKIGHKQYAILSGPDLENQVNIAMMYGYHPVGSITIDELGNRLQAVQR